MPRSVPSSRQLSHDTKPFNRLHQNLLEQDHRAIKRRVNASQGFRSFWAAWRTLAGYEVIHMIRKGQACGSALTRVGLLHRFIVGMFGLEV